MTYQSEILVDNPWGFWEQAETSGSTLADSSPNARTMTITGTPALAQAGPSSAEKGIAWGTGGNYASTAVTVSTSDVTFEAWINLPALPANSTAILGCAAALGSSTTDKTFYIDTNGVLHWFVYTGVGNNIVAPTPLTLNTWHHVVASTGAAGSKIRVDKTTVVTQGSTTTYTGAQKVFIHAGGSGFTDSRAVTIAAPALYTVQLADARTDAHFDAISSGGGGAPPPFTGTWGIEF